MSQVVNEVCSSHHLKRMSKSVEMARLLKEFKSKSITRQHTAKNVLLRMHSFTTMEKRENKSLTID